MYCKSLLLLSLILLLSGCKFDKKEESQSSISELDEILLDFYHAEPQKRNDRIILGNVLFRNQLNLSQGANIFRPSTMAYTGNTVVFFDYGSSALIHVEDSREISSLEVSGRGPGEFLNPVDIKAFNGQLYIADSRLGKISVYDDKLNLQEDIMLDFLPHRLAVQDNMLLMNSNFDGAGLFVLTDSSGAVKEKFETGIANPAAAFYVQGTLECANNAYYYGSMGLGILKKFDNRGKLIWSRQTIEDFELIPMHISLEGDGMSGVRMHPERIYRITDMLVNDDRLYALHSGELRRSTRFIDTYDTRNGEYLGTWESELSVFSIAVNEEGEMAALIYDDETEDFLLGYFDLE